MSSWQESRGHALLHGGFTEGRMDESIVVEGLEAEIKRFNSIMLNNPDFDKKVRAIVKTFLRKVARKTGERATSYMDSDLRQAYKAVQSSVYKRILGGNVNIISRRRASSKTATLPAVRDRGHLRGGNRRERSPYTERIMSYWGADRGFVLRFLNDGTKKRRIRTGQNRRVTKFVGRGHTSASLEAKRNGNRGRITARHWFKGESMEGMETNMQAMVAEIEELVKQMWQGPTAKLDYVPLG